MRLVNTLTRQMARCHDSVQVDRVYWDAGVTSLVVPIFNGHGVIDEDNGLLRSLPKFLTGLLTTR